MNLQDQLIRLGNTNPDLREHIRPILNKTARSKQAVSKPPGLKVDISSFDAPWQIADAHGLEDLYFEDIKNQKSTLTLDGYGFGGFIIGVFPDNAEGKDGYPINWDPYEFVRDLESKTPFSDIQIFDEDMDGKIILEI